MNIGLWDVLGVIGGLGAFFLVPIGTEIMKKRYRIRVLGQELAGLVLPIIASVGFYKRDWEMGMFGLIASVGLFLGFWYIHKKNPRSDAIGMLLMGIISAVVSGVIVLGLIVWRWNEGG